ncbi:hypothetical protein V5N11_002638 [Cardamine amara subsp. amara]|uniref:Uncharacterized protein n=1 Tax=Cardamine amara subsp. amara TaxID=228776 RepID=A0ABD1A3R0_CARAN
MSSDHLDAALNETSRWNGRTPYPLANTKVPHGGLGDSFSSLREISEEEVPSESSNIQIPSGSRLDGKVTNTYYEYIELSQRNKPRSCRSRKGLLGPSSRHSE